MACKIVLNRMMRSRSIPVIWDEISAFLKKRLAVLPVDNNNDMVFYLKKPSVRHIENVILPSLLFPNLARGLSTCNPCCWKKLFWIRTLALLYSSIWAVFIHFRKLCVSVLHEHRYSSERPPICLFFSNILLLNMNNMFQKLKFSLNFIHTFFLRTHFHYTVQRMNQNLAIFAETLLLTNMINNPWWLFIINSVWYCESLLTFASRSTSKMRWGIVIVLFAVWSLFDKWEKKINVYYSPHSGEHV